MTIGFGFYSSKVYKTSDKVWKYRAVVKFIVKAVKFEKVVIAIKKPAGFAVKGACLAKHSEKSGSFTMNCKQL